MESAPHSPKDGAVIVRLRVIEAIFAHHHVRHRQIHGAVVLRAVEQGLDRRLRVGGSAFLEHRLAERQRIGRRSADRSRPPRRIVRRLARLAGGEQRRPAAYSSAACASDSRRSTRARNRSSARKQGDRGKNDGKRRQEHRRLAEFAGELGESARAATGSREDPAHSSPTIARAGTSATVSTPYALRMSGSVTTPSSVRTLARLTTGSTVCRVAPMRRSASPSG